MGTARSVQEMVIARNGQCKNPVNEHKSTMCQINHAHAPRVCGEGGGSGLSAKVRKCERVKVA